MNKKLWFSLIAVPFMVTAANAKVIESDSKKVEVSKLEAESSKDRYIVSFKNLTKGKKALKALGADIALELKSINAVAAKIPQQALKGLQNNPNVEFIEVDTIRKPLSLEATQATTWGISDSSPNGVRAELPLASDSSTMVCIIDSGLYSGHSDFNHSNVIYNNSNSSEDLCGHGTHVAGTIAALNDSHGVKGVDDSLKLGIVQVFSGSNCAWTYSSDLIAAAEECKTLKTQHGADKMVISMSLGGSFKSRSEDRAFSQLAAEGVLSVAAAGNDGNTRKSYPASYDSVVSVAASDINGNVASFSQQNDAVEVAAPGVDVLSTVPFLPTASLEVAGQKYEVSAIEESFYSNGVSGTLVDGGLCLSGQIPAQPTGLEYVVHCRRGDIAFSEKVLNVEAAVPGAVAVIISNNEAGPLAATMAGVVTNIPSVGVSQADGNDLLLKLGSSAVVVNQDPANIASGSGWEAWNGTSMATPHVSGLAAKVWNSNSTATADQVRRALRVKSVRDNALGYGIVNQADAVSNLQAIIEADQNGGGGTDPVDPVDPGINCRKKQNKSLPECQ